MREASGGRRDRTTKSISSQNAGIEVRLGAAQRRNLCLTLAHTKTSDVGNHRYEGTREENDSQHYQSKGVNVIPGPSHANRQPWDSALQTIDKAGLMGLAIMEGRNGTVCRTGCLTKE